MTYSGESGELSQKTRLARNLRAARKVADNGKEISQAQVAKRLGVSRQTVNRSEREDDNAPMPSRKFLDAAAKLYGTTVQALRYGGAGQQVAEGRPNEERAWLYSFASRLAAVGASEREIAQAQALLTESSAVAFFGSTITAMEQLSMCVESELRRRHGVAGRPITYASPGETEGRPSAASKTAAKSTAKKGR